MRFAFLALLGLLLAGCATTSTTPTASTDTVLAVDVLQTLPGEQANYLQFIELNWKAARAAAMEEGAVVDYEVLVREPSPQGWDVVLITEYASEEAYNNREEIFAKLFERPELAMKRIDGKGPRDMARFVEGDVMLRRAGVRGALLND